MFNAQQTRYDIFISNKNGLSVSRFAVPFDNPFLDEKQINEPFLFRYDFNKVIYCSRWGVKKVYCIIEDLLQEVSNIFCNMATIIFNSVQGTMTTITSTPLGINTYAHKTNLSSLSTNSILSINNLNATSTSTLGLEHGHIASIAN
jgi:hypothetical protein